MVGLVIGVIAGALLMAPAGVLQRTNLGSGQRELEATTVLPVTERATRGTPLPALPVPETPTVIATQAVVTATHSDGTATAWASATPSATPSPTREPIETREAAVQTPTAATALKPYSVTLLGEAYLSEYIVASQPTPAAIALAEPLEFTVTLRTNANLEGAKDMGPVRITSDPGGNFVFEAWITTQAPITLRDATQPRSRSERQRRCRFARAR